MLNPQTKQTNKWAILHKFSVPEESAHVLIDSSFWFDTVNLGWSIVYIEESQVIISKFNCISFSNDCFSLSKPYLHRWNVVLLPGIEPANPGQDGSSRALHEGGLIIFQVCLNDDHMFIFTFSKQAFNESLDFCNRSLPHERYKIWLTAAKLTCLCNSLQTSNSFARCDTGVVIDSKRHLSWMCKTSFLFAPFGCVITGYSAFPFYTLTKPLIQLYFKYKTVLIPKLKIFLFLF